MNKRPCPVPGFRFSGISCGIKENAALDLGLIVADEVCNAAAVFTQNLVQAAPVIKSRKAIEAGRVRAILVNSGNANACTGNQGVIDAGQTIAKLAKRLNCNTDLIQIGSTGVIGVPLPIDRILSHLDEVVDVADRDQTAADRFGDAICTTDRFPKGCSKTHDGYTISVFAKGAGMIAPNMATMLAYALTDAPIDSQDLKVLWQRCVDRSFNSVVVDGDTSTNDTAVICTSGRGQPLQGDDLESFERTLLDACQEAAIQLVEDGEGARCVVELNVMGADSETDARIVATTIALSPLCKTAFFGADPNWGRIVAAAGRSSVSFDPNLVRLTLRDRQQSIVLFECGVPLPFDKLVAEQLMHGNRFAFDLDLGIGASQSRIWTCDLGHNYVTLNAEYTT